MIADHPLHRSGRAAFPHPALASGDDAKSPQRIGMTDAGRRQPAVDEPPHPVPAYAAVLAAPRQRAMPEPADLEPERGAAPGCSWARRSSGCARRRPSAATCLLRDGVVHASPQLGFDLAQLRLQPLADRLPQHREASVAPLLPADVREAEKVERLRLPLSAPLRFSAANGPNSSSRVFSGCSSSRNFRTRSASSAQNRSASDLILESHHDVVGKPHDDDVAAAPASGAMPGPTGQTRSGDRRSPAAAMHCRPGASPPPLASASPPPARRRSAISG